MHIYDFLTDDVQKKLKEQSRFSSSARFEDALDSYKQRFMQSFENAPHNLITLTTTDKPKHLPELFKNDPHIQKWFDTLFRIVKSEENTLKRLFEDIIDCYFLFIRGRHHTAVLMMFDILEKYDMLNDAWKGCFGLYYRCANLWSGADENNLATYYHIPFTLRGKIKNQRFSVSGMPIWYGGASLLTSYYEMRQKILDKHDTLAISIWGFDPLAFRKSTLVKTIRSRTKVYDITNEIYETINMAFAKFIDTHDEHTRSTFFEAHPLFYEKAMRIFLRKFVLSNLCTFKTSSDEEHFHEEYVLPQILTEAIRLHKYDGVLFPSTQFDKVGIEFKGKQHSNFYKSNLAMFTEYDINRPYDQELIDNFDTVIVTKDIISNLDIHKYLGEINGISTEAVSFLKQLLPKEHFETRDWYMAIIEQLLDQLEVYKTTSVEGVLYLDTLVGKIELYGIWNYQRNLYFQAIGLFKEEYEQWEEDKNGKQN